MRKFLLLFSLLFAGHMIFAQMYVSPSSYVFVNDQFVYVTQNVNLNGTGAVYLRKESQLLQGTTAASTNAGTGILSAYQEGTSNPFGYNAWCSPVGSADGTTGNSVFVTSQIFRPTGVRTSNVATFTSAFDGLTNATSLVISDKWIWSYVAANAYNPGGASGWVYVGTIGALNPGNGFTMKGVGGTDATVSNPISGSIGDGIQNNPGFNQRYDFRGKPNDGNISIVVGSTAGTFYPNQTLTGNPYPSAINLNLFLLENSGYLVNYATGTYTTVGAPVANINGNAYFWEHRKTAASHVLATYEAGYGTYAPTGALVTTPGTYTSATWNTYNPDGSPNTTGASSGVAYRRMFSPIGQGFMIRGVVGGSGSATMRNRYRTFVKEGIASNSQFERASSATVSGDENWPNIPNVAGIAYENYSNLPSPQFKLNTVLNNQFTRESAIAFNNSATSGYDMALDAITPENLPNDMYYPINGADKFVINTLPFDIDAKIPVAFTATEQTNFRVTVSELINFNLAENIYIHDKDSDIFYDIKNGFFDVTLPSGTNDTQYEITFRNGTELLETALTDLENSFIIFQNNNNSMLTIANSSKLDVSNVTVYDVTGKLVISKANLGTASQIELPTISLSDGIYVVKVTTNDNLAISRKVSIFKK